MEVQIHQELLSVFLIYKTKGGKCCQFSFLLFIDTFINSLSELQQLSIVKQHNSLYQAIMMEQESKSTITNNNSSSNNNEGGKKQHFNKNSNKQSSITSKKFEGCTPELNGHVITGTGIQQADEYNITICEIGEHIARTFKEGQDVHYVFKKLEHPTLTPPQDPSKNATNTQMHIWEKKVDNFVEREDLLDANLEKAYQLVKGQCSDIIQAKLKALDNYNTMETNSNLIELLKSPKGITYNFNNQQYVPQLLYDTMSNFYHFRQPKDMTMIKYLEAFTNLVDIIEQYKGTIGHDQALLENDPTYKALNTPTDNQTTEAKDHCREQFLAYALIAKANPNRFGHLQKELDNNFAKGNNQYPKMIMKAYQLLILYCEYKPRNNTTKSTEGVSFHQNNNSNGKSKANNNISCAYCKEEGHHLKDCPILAKKNNNNNNKQQQGTANAQTSQETQESN